MASASVQCILSCTTGLPSQSVVYTIPGAPSAFHASSTARLKRFSAASMYFAAPSLLSLCADKAHWVISLAHSMPCPGVAPYGLNWSAGCSLLHSKSATHSFVKCSGILQLLSDAHTSTWSMIRPALLRYFSSPVTSAAARNASTVCILAFKPR